MKRTIKLFLIIALPMALGFTACSDDDNNEKTYPDVGFNDIASVFAEVKDNETVIFLLRHGERGEDYSPAGLLTENGKAQARTVGGKIKNGEQAFYAPPTMAARNRLAKTSPSDVATTSYMRNGAS